MKQNSVIQKLEDLGTPIFQWCKFHLYQDLRQLFSTLFFKFSSAHWLIENCLTKRAEIIGKQAKKFMYSWLSNK